MTTKFNVAIQTYNKSHSTEHNKQTANYQRSELQTTNQMPEHPDCLSCGKNIRDPLCPNCIAKAFLQWSTEFPEHFKIKHTLNTFMRYYNHIEGNSKKCIHCGKDIHICPHCFAEYLYELTKKADMTIQAIAQFLFLFNFDLY